MVSVRLSVGVRVRVWLNTPVPSVNYCDGLIVVFCIVSCLYLCSRCCVSVSLPNFR